MKLAGDQLISSINAAGQRHFCSLVASGDEQSYCHFCLLLKSPKKQEPKEAEHPLLGLVLVLRMWVGGVCRDIRAAFHRGASLRANPLVGNMHSGSGRVKKAAGGSRDASCPAGSFPSRGEEGIRS